MNTIHLDTSGLRDIRLNAENVPRQIYVDGSEFLNRLEIILNQQVNMASEEFEKQKREERRDMFAAKAMQAYWDDVFSKVVGENLKEITPNIENKLIELGSALSYKIADSMMKARETKNDE